jgi:transposase
MTVLHRLNKPGSDRAAEKRQNGYKIEGVEGIFQRSRDLFGDLRLVFFDTTSIYFEGNGGEEIGAYGHSKDHRPDLKQMVVGLVIDSTGRPICCELWPGNTTDVKTLMPIIDRLKIRFGIQRVCIVADRGMISKETIREIEETEGIQYIGGVRMGNQKEVREDVLSRGGRYKEVYPKSSDSKAPSPLKVKEVNFKGRRYIISEDERRTRHRGDSDFRARGKIRGITDSESDSRCGHVEIYTEVRTDIAGGLCKDCRGI